MQNLISYLGVVFVGPAGGSVQPVSGGPFSMMD